MRKYLIILLVFITSNYSATYYVSVNGKESNSGEENSPLTLFSAIAKVSAGDTILIENGTYIFSSTINISKSGIENKRCCLFAKSEERPLLDFSSMSTDDSNYGIKLSGNFWHIKGIRIKGAGDNGLLIQGGSNNIIEYCDFFENDDSGCQLKGGAANNLIINCDSYDNRDPDEGDADGFAPKMDVGSGNTFVGCRAWNNSDDGWDGYLRGTDNVNTILENCWCFKNGYRKDGTESSGNGNGFKMGGSDDKNLKHNFTLIRCLTYGNRVKGFDQNNNRGAIILYNCTAFSNGTNYSVNGETCSLTVVNCIASGSGSNSIKGGVQKTNDFNVPTSNFLSIDPAELKAPRLTDGSLPEIKFMHLVSNSSLVDTGTIIEGIRFSGVKPDLGCFEFEQGTYISTLHKTDTDQNSIFTVCNGKLLFRLPSTNTYSPIFVKLFSLNGVCRGEYVASVKATNHQVFFITLKKFSSGYYCVTANRSGREKNGKFVNWH